ncbi:MAG: DUF1294 domain-containing protein [Candidatus Scalindua sp.]|jgi:uncharacterized membrane protein YsdA (DUF1294 family)/cold shock CspA family protein|nr:DUF1294 domain-containing protein [Candidatus Scalindua sp.]
MRGIVVKFDVDRGFGFIRSAEAPKDVFVHIKEVEGRLSIRVGQKVEFRLVETDRGPSAKNVVLGRHQMSPKVLYGSIAFICVLLPFVIMVAYRWNILFAYFASINAATFILYGYDKAIAGSSVLRIPEFVLQALAIFGGSPAALAAQRIFRHKTIKESFQVVFWVSVVVQIILVVWSFSR